MKQKIIRFFAAFLSFIILFSFVTVNASVYDRGEQSPYTSYTYWYNTGNSSKAVFTRPMYQVSKTLDYIDIGNEKQFTKITDIFSDKKGFTYILDGGASSVFILNENYLLYKSFSDVSDNGESISFKNAQGIFVDSNGEIYISDTENGRVIVTDEDGNLLKKYVLPKSRLIPSSFNYRPIKASTDSKGYLYVLSDGSYYGAVLYSPNDEFLGFYGANTVKSTVTQAISKFFNKIFLTNEKRAQLETTLPYQFTDLFIDKNDFVYTATGNTAFDKNEGQIGQIRRLNPGGTNVLVSSDSIDYSDGSGTFRQDLLGLSADDDGYIYALDSAYGHIFIYDKNSVCLAVFGCGSREGIQDGSFTSAQAITLNGSDVLVADSELNTVTVFTITPYGELVKSAQTLTNSGNYIAAKELWQQVLSKDSQSQLAYRGIAKAYYDEGNYSKTLSYAKTGYDRETYALAFKEIRNEWISNNFMYLVITVIALIVLIIFILRYKRKKNIKILTKKARLALSVLSHPGTAFEEIKLKNNGSYLIAIILLAIYFVTYVMQYTNGGFCYVAFDASNFNSLFVLLRSAGLVVLFSICYWGVSTLMSGQGKIGEIFTVVCYCLQPMIIGNIVFILLTNVMLPEEIAFLDLFTKAMLLYSAFLLIRGLMRISDYEFGKFAGVTVLTVCGMVIVLFIGIVVILLLQLLFGFFSTVITETFKIVSFGG